MGCGICGFIGLNDSKLLRDMCRVLTHRGPDEEGNFLDDKVGLGIRRLSIIDLVTGKQPISDEDGSIWIVFNGEIYNYVELRSELQKLGHSFSTNSDTEVIVHAYEEWGVSCLDLFVGMFAFALWDKELRRLFLARDRFGKKPLFYAFLDGALIFASEMKAILQYDGVKREIDYDALDHFLTYFYIPSPKTIFRAVQKVPPASYILFSRNHLQVETYWDMYFPSISNQLSEDSIIQHLYSMLKDSVQMRLRSDVPIGAFLSGGIDSSCVSAFISSISKQPVKTFTIGFEEHPYDEMSWARRVADHLGTDHHEFVVRPKAIELLPKLLWHFDEPFSDPSMIPTYYVSEITRRNVKVALSGDGGDEIFMGYPFLVDPPTYRYYNSNPPKFKRYALKILSSAPISNPLSRIARKVYERDYSEQSARKRYFLRVAHFDQDELEEMYTKQFKASHTIEDTEAYLQNYFNEVSSKDFFNAADFVTIKTYLAEDILVKTDRMSMAVSLELRSPFLDHRLAAFIQSVPSSMKIRGSSMKYILKKMALHYNLIPKEIIFREKHGFGVPIEYWFRGEWSDLTIQLLDEGFSKCGLSTILHRDSVRKLLSKPVMNTSKIFALLVLTLWYKMFIERQDKNPPLSINKYI